MKVGAKPHPKAPKTHHTHKPPANMKYMVPSPHKPPANMKYMVPSPDAFDHKKK